MPTALLRKHRLYDVRLGRLRRVLPTAIPTGRSVSIEKLVEMFPWARWSDVFLVIAQLGRKGEITFHQHGFDFEIWSRQKPTKL